MAFWYRIKPSNIKNLSNQFKRCYFQIPRPCLANHSVSLTTNRVLICKPTWVIHNTQIEFANTVRFFAAPVQVRPKQEEKNSGRPRLNQQITAEFVRLVTDQGHSVVSRHEALKRARSLDVDLVEVQRNAKPPVCKLMDYHKEKYKQQTKEKDRAKSKSELTLKKANCKEVRFACKTEQKDLKIKADTVKRLMERGYRVKCMALGTEEQDLGGLLSRLSAMIEDVSLVESGPRVEKKQAYIIVRHIKFGPSKKGKKASKVGATSPDNKKDDNSCQVGNPSTINESTILSEDSGSETEDEIFSEQEDNQQPSWSVSDANDDFDSAFDIGDDAKVAKICGDTQMKIAPEKVLSPASSFPDFMHPKPVFDSTETVPPSPSKAPLGTDERYIREPKNIYPPTRPMDGKGSGTRDSTRVVPQSPNQQRQPQIGLNASPSAPSYGIFSATKANDTSEKNGIAAEVNRYKNGNAIDSTRHPRPRGFSGNPNSPTTNSDSSGRASVDNSCGQGRWGLFSGERSNVMPSGNPDSRAKAQG